MSLLDAALAFALTMLLFATIVSAIVSTIYNVLGVKEKGLKKFLKAFFDVELSNVLHAELDHAAAKAETEISDSLRAAANKVIGVVGKETGASSHSIADSLISKADSKKIVRCSTDEFIFELKTSEFGKKVISEFDDKGEELFKRIADRYDNFGKDFSGIFKKDIRIVSTVIGFVLAFAVNVDSVHLIATYISNNQISMQIVNPHDDTDYQNDIESKYKSLPASVSSSSASPSVSDANYDPSHSLDLISSSIDELRADSFPVGWSLFPHCPPHSTDYRCETQLEHDASEVVAASSSKMDVAKAEVKNLGIHFSLYITWFLGCLLTGLLSGLGAPFWYDVVRSISQFGKKAIKA